MDKGESVNCKKTLNRFRIWWEEGVGEEAKRSDLAVSGKIKLIRRGREQFCLICDGGERSHCWCEYTEKKRRIVGVGAKVSNRKDNKKKKKKHKNKPTTNKKKKKTKNKKKKNQNHKNNNTHTVYIKIRRYSLCNSLEE